MNRGRVWAMVVAGLLGIHAASSLSAYPNFLAYSNELWGGPSKTYRVLSDSNVDWGQGLPAARAYLANRAGTPCWMAYFGSVDPAYYGIPCKQFPVHESSFWGRPMDIIPPVVQGDVLMSATEMSGQLRGPAELNPYEQFQKLPPAECLAGSILVFHGSFNVPLASALSRLGRIADLAHSQNYDAALEEARSAEALAPQSVDVQFSLGQVLRLMGRNEEARQAFQTALLLAQTNHPEAQSYWVPLIKGELRSDGE
jgi:tetratricopeptide (TPR) repeat protein